MSPRAPRISPWALRILLLAATLGLCVLAVRRFDFPRLGETLKGADFRLFAAALAINLSLNPFARVMRWKALLDPLPRTGPAPTRGELMWLLFAGQAATNLLPGRAGEALRTIVLHRRNGYPAGAVLASQLVEKLIEALSLALFALPLLAWSGVRGSRALTTAIGGVIAGGAIGLLAAIVVARTAPRNAAPIPATARTPRAALGRLIARLREGVALIHTGQIWARALAFAVLADLADVAMVGLCLHAAGIALAVPGWVAVWVAMNIAIALPSTPGQVGVLEAAAVLALGLLGVARGEALAFAILYHAAHLVPGTALGLFGPFRLIDVNTAIAKKRRGWGPRDAHLAPRSDPGKHAKVPPDPPDPP